MPVFTEAALTSDTEGLEFRQDVLGPREVAEQPGRRFPLEAWTAGTASPAAEIAPEDRRAAIPLAPSSDMLLPEMA